MRSFLFADKDTKEEKDDKENIELTDILEEGKKISGGWIEEEASRKSKIQEEIQHQKKKRDK